MKPLLLLSISAATALGLGATALKADPAQPPNQQPKDAIKPGVHLTVYDTFALVKDRRELPDEFKKAPTSSSSVTWRLLSIRPASTSAR